MDDWEQPSTTSLRVGSIDGGGDGRIEDLQQQLAVAVDRIEALEKRVRQLEGRAQTA